MSSTFSLGTWKAHLLDNCRPKSRLETERFFAAITEGEQHLKLHPYEIGKVLFSVFSSYQDHGIYERVYSAIQGLGVEEYYSSLLDNLDRLIREDPQDFWRTHLFTYAARPLQDVDVEAVLRAVARHPPELQLAFASGLRKSGEPLAEKILRKMADQQGQS